MYVVRQGVHTQNWLKVCLEYLSNQSILSLESSQHSNWWHGEDPGKIVDHMTRTLPNHEPISTLNQTPIFLETWPALRKVSALPFWRPRWPWYGTWRLIIGSLGLSDLKSRYNALQTLWHCISVWIVSCVKSKMAEYNVRLTNFVNEDVWPGLEEQHILACPAKQGR